MNNIFLILCILFAFISKYGCMIQTFPKLFWDRRNLFLGDMMKFDQDIYIYIYIYISHVDAQLFFKTALALITL